MRIALYKNNILMGTIIAPDEQWAIDHIMKAPLESLPEIYQGIDRLVKVDDYFTLLNNHSFVKSSPNSEIHILDPGQSFHPQLVQDLLAEVIGASIVVGITAILGATGIVGSTAVVGELG